MPDTTAKIRAKGLDGTGFTEAHAREAAYGLGRYTISQIHPVPISDGADLDEHLRRLQETLNYNRRVEDPEQPRLEGIDEPQPLGEVIAQGVNFVSADDQDG